jgi:hypothetical protein
VNFVSNFIIIQILLENEENMNRKKVSSRQTQLMTVAIVAAVTMVAAASIYSINNGQALQKATAQTSMPETEANIKNNNNATASTNPTAVGEVAAVKVVEPSKSTNKEFWINTVHLDGMTNINGAMKCDTCPQNTPLHPAEQPPANSTIPTGGGFVLTPPNKVGAWDFRSFTFAPEQIVVNQGDNVTLHFVGVQGVHHVIEIEGVDTFELTRGQIHTVSFIANNPGTITFYCHVHMPNMVGQILVLPKAAV